MMFWLLNDSRPWFRHKTFGYGPGLPIVWQGWALLASHLALLIGLGTLLRDKPVALVAVALMAALLPMPFYAARTEGGWRWRWGGDK